MSLRPCMTACGLAHALEPGLQALGAHSKLVRVKRPSQPIDSINLDAALVRSQGQDARWDYGVGIRDGASARAVWIEVHPASSSDVESVLRKLKWLKAYLGPPACQGARSFHWIATGSVDIDGKRMRRLATAGIPSPKKMLHL